MCSEDVVPRHSCIPITPRNAPFIPLLLLYVFGYRHLGMDDDKTLWVAQVQHSRGSYRARRTSLHMFLTPDIAGLNPIECGPEQMSLVKGTSPSVHN